MDITSDSDDALDEIVITPSSFDFPQYDLLNPPSSPIHNCDTSNQSDETPQNNRSVDEHDQSIHTCNQLSTESCTYKNSTSRRMEYSMRGMKPTSNPSQDSAFGSMTDGEQSIASSSVRLSSFQSISSPIDEGVEDVTNLVIDSTSPKTDSNISSPCKDSGSTSSGYHHNDYIGFARSTSDSVSLERKSIENVLTLEPPKILVTDQSSFYTTSPSKTCATVEVFSQKYRVSSFEDMSMKRTSLRNVNKLAFRSLEEERRIDSAFNPIRSPESHQVLLNNSEKFKKLTHAVFSSKISTTKERHTKWKNSILARKNNLIKSNESLLENPGQHHQMSKRVHSNNELFCNRYETDNGGPDVVKNYPRKSRSERHLFSLTKLKQSAITDYDECDDEKLFSIVSRNESVCFNDESSSSDSSPNHRDVCQIIGGLEPDPGSTEEKTPLLEGMEMSPISPIESDEML